ncbi:MAG TPA: cupin domain-containing protein [Acidimicrobiales bacterium]
MDPDEVIERLGLVPHPEGGHYCETWRAASAPGERASGTAIYFLLRRGEVSHWHRVDAAEVWHHYAGGPLELAIAERDDGPVRTYVLGTDLAAGERPQVVVPAHAWQHARPLGEWVLTGCTVSPAFDFDGFELAAPGWSPGGWSPGGWSPAGGT